MIFTLANEALEKNTWYPLSLGWLVVLAGIGMFFGSTYLLLATNVGSRLGFLIVGSVATGFIAILSVLWVSTSTPLNVFKGRQEAWKPIAIVQTPKDAKVSAVKTIEEKGEKLSSTQFANIKAAADTLLAVPDEHSAVEPAEAIAEDLPKAEVIVTTIYGVGGSQPNPLHFEFSHTPEYAAVEYCQLDVEKSETAFRSTCDTSTEAEANHKFLILEKDLGSLRQPPLFLFFGSSALFAMFLLALYWREQDEKDGKSPSDADSSSSDAVSPPASVPDPSESEVSSVAANASSQDEPTSEGGNEE